MSTVLYGPDETNLTDVQVAHLAAGDLGPIAVWEDGNVYAPTQALIRFRALDKPEGAMRESWAAGAVQRYDLGDKQRFIPTFEDPDAVMSRTREGLGIVRADGECVYNDGLLARGREDGPAIAGMHYHGYYREGLLERLDGPASYSTDGLRADWYIGQHCVTDAVMRLQDGIYTPFNDTHHSRLIDAEAVHGPGKSQLYAAALLYRSQPDSESLVAAVLKEGVSFYKASHAEHDQIDVVTDVLREVAGPTAFIEGMFGEDTRYAYERYQDLFKEGEWVSGDPHLWHRSDGNYVHVDRPGSSGSSYGAADEGVSMLCGSEIPKMHPRQYYAAQYFGLELNDFRQTWSTDLESQPPDERGERVMISSSGETVRWENKETGFTRDCRISHEQSRPVAHDEHYYYDGTTRITDGVAYIRGEGSAPADDIAGLALCGMLLGAGLATDRDQAVEYCRAHTDPMSLLMDGMELLNEGARDRVLTMLLEEQIV